MRPCSHHSVSELTQRCEEGQVGHSAPPCDQDTGARESKLPRSRMRKAVAFCLELCHLLYPSRLVVQRRAQESRPIFEGGDRHIDVAVPHLDYEGANASGVAKEVSDASGRTPSLRLALASMKGDSGLEVVLSYCFVFALLS